MMLDRALSKILNRGRAGLNAQIASQNETIRKLKKALSRHTRYRDSLGEVMAFAKDQGLVPGTIIDVGVNTGTPGLYDSFPEAKYLLVDPLKESEIFMADICESMKDARYFVAAAGPAAGKCDISIPPSFGGTVLASTNKHKNAKETRSIDVVALDDLCAKSGAQGPYIIKVDTEGAELEVLKGAGRILPETEMMILESRVRPIGQAPEIFEILSFLKERGFVLYDLIDRNYNDWDGALKQFDIVVVRENGYFRTPQAYKALKAPKPVTHEQIHSGKLSKRQRLLEELLQRRPHLKSLLVE